MRISWCAIACINFLWCAFLWKERKRNHPWLLSFFLVYFISDTSMLLASPSSAGGFNLLGPSLIGQKQWVFIACIAWMGWFVIPILAGCKLALGRVPWWCTVSLVMFCIGLSGSEYMGLTGLQRRFVMHVVWEPIMLVIALVLVACYVYKAVRAGEHIDFLSFAVAATAMMLLLKLALILDSIGMLSRWQSHTFFYLYMTTVVGFYFGQKRLRRWMLSQLS